MEWTSIFHREVSEYTQDQWELQFDDTIAANKNGDWEQYIRRTCARFKCSLCPRTWPSNRVTVIFHFHLNKNTHQGTVKMHIFRQKCKKCAKAQMEPPKLHKEKIEILMENLVKNIRKKCYDETFDYVPRDVTCVPVRNPHEPEHCEGCMAGACIKGPMPNVFHGGRGRGYRGAWA